MPVDLAEDDEKEEEVPGSLFLGPGTDTYNLRSSLPRGYRHLTQKHAPNLLSKCVIVPGFAPLAGPFEVFVEIGLDKEDDEEAEAEALASFLSSSAFWALTLLSDSAIVCICCL